MAEKILKVAKRVFIDVPKRRRVTGSVTTGGTRLALYTGMFVAHSIIVSNNSTSSDWLEIYDDTTLIIGRRTLAANSTYEILDCDIPFYVSVAVNSGTTTMKFTFSGWVP